MSTVPDKISPRTLFWLWYDRATLTQRETSRADFQRFVDQAEKVVPAKQAVVPELSAPSASTLPKQAASVNYLPNSSKQTAKEHSQILRLRSQQLRAQSQAQVAKSQSLRNKSESLLNKSQAKLSAR